MRQSLSVLLLVLPCIAMIAPPEAFDSRVEAVSPVADFSFDYHDLELTPVAP